MIEANSRSSAHPVDHSRVRVPTLVLRRPRNLTQRPDIVTRVAEEIEGATLVDLPGDDDLAIGADVDALIAEIARFLTGAAYVPPPTRSLCAILFTDLVSSTERAAELGDERWKAVLDRHDNVARTVVTRCGGRVVKSTATACSRSSLGHRCAAGVGADRCALPSRARRASASTSASWKHAATMSPDLGPRGRTCDGSAPAARSSCRRPCRRSRPGAGRVRVAVDTS
jgi:class 3 adenylate cyclase